MMNHAEPEPQNDLPTPPERKPYHAPRLTIYGTIQELTQASIRNGTDNSPIAPNGSNM